VVILPETDEAEALGVAQRARARLAADSERPALTTSVGVALFPSDGETAEELLGTADRALYGMKEARA
jgi:diguanylate cyclase (GGDEF)-like protein